MKIFDCTTYYSEDLILDLRFNILNDYVYKFIVVESKYSHSGKPKELYFDINNFKKFKDKIIHLVIEEEPKDIQKINDKENSSIIKRINSLKRIEQSYNFMNNGIAEADDDDLIVLSDNDEIPNFNSIYFKNVNNNIYIFKQLFFYYKFNLLYDRMYWFGSKACKKKKLKSFSWLRNLKNKKYPLWRIDSLFSETKQFNLEIINDGGWHFTNVKSPEELYEKLSNYGHHNEFEDAGYTLEDIKDQIKRKIVNYDHLADKIKVNKKNFEFKLKKVTNNVLPNYLQLNQKLYKEWFD